jgi:hypothetical protein
MVAADRQNSCPGSQDLHALIHVQFTQRQRDHPRHVRCKCDDAGIGVAIGRVDGFAQGAIDHSRISVVMIVGRGDDEVGAGLGHGNKRGRQGLVAVHEGQDWVLGRRE